MIIAYHLIWTAYGWWLPNDPRGSNSHEIRVERIADLGDLHAGRKRIQPASATIRQFYAQARDRLAHPLLTLADEEVTLLGTCFGEVIEDRRYTCFACAIMPDHVHLLIRTHRDWAEDMIETFQHASRTRLIESGRRAPTHPVWGGSGWKVFLNTPDEVRRVVEYIRQNPIKIGKPEQRWEFVSRYDGWAQRDWR